MYYYTYSLFWFATILMIFVPVCSNLSYNLFWFHNTNFIKWVLSSYAAVYAKMVLFCLLNISLMAFVSTKHLGQESLLMRSFKSQFQFLQHRQVYSSYLLFLEWTLVPGVYQEMLTFRVLNLGDILLIPFSYYTFYL
jgi:hypothetical protein